MLKPWKQNAGVLKMNHVWTTGRA